MNLLRISFVFLICVILIGLVESRPRPRPWSLKKTLAKVGQKIKSGVQKAAKVVKEVGNKVAEGAKKVGENLVKASKVAVKEVKKRCSVLENAEENNKKIQDIIKKAGGVAQIAKIVDGIKNKKKALVIISTSMSILNLLKDHICSS